MKVDLRLLPPVALVLSLLLLLLLPSLIAGDSFNVFHDSGCRSQAPHNDVLRAAISTPGLSDGGACSAVPMPSLALSAPWTAWVRYSYTATPHSPSGVAAAFTLYHNSSCDDSAIWWRISATTTTDTITCTPAAFTTANDTTGTLTSSPVWVTIERSSTPSPDPDSSISATVVAAVVGVAVVGAAALIVAIWMCNRGPSRTMEMRLSPEVAERWYHAMQAGEVECKGMGMERD
jgi:hypothetical protein